MRQAGFADTVDGLGGHDHLCWAFDTPGEYRSMAGRFLADGLANGQRVFFIADAPQDSDLDSIDGFAAARATGAAQVQDLRFYSSDWQHDPTAQVRVYAQATEQALTDGYTGLRIAADATTLVATADTRAIFARYEHLIDTYMTRHPFSAMCGYNRQTLGDDAVADLACMHPLARRSSTPLRVFASDHPGIAAALAGDIDCTGHAQLRTVIDRVDLTGIDNMVTIDARGLSFIDHRGLIHLIEHIRRRGATTILHVSPRSSVPMLADLLRLPDLETVVS